MCKNLLTNLCKKSVKCRKRDKIPPVSSLLAREECRNKPVCKKILTRHDGFRRIVRKFNWRFICSKSYATFINVKQTVQTVQLKIAEVPFARRGVLFEKEIPGN